MLVTAFGHFTCNTTFCKTVLNGLQWNLIPRLDDPLNGLKNINSRWHFWFTSILSYRANSNLISFFLYFTLKHCINPISKDWWKEVIFLGKNIILMLLYFSFKLIGCTVASSGNNISPGGLFFDLALLKYLSLSQLASKTFGLKNTKLVKFS